MISGVKYRRMFIKTFVLMCKFVKIVQVICTSVKFGYIVANIRGS